MAKKEFVVIGCGLFGYNIAMTLADLGYDVIAVDKDQDTVNELADYVTYAVCADAAQDRVLEELGVSNVDIAIIGIGTDFEASIMATLACKNLGVPKIIAKAKSESHANILKKIGATEVVIPERDMGLKVAHSLASRNVVEFIELSDDYSMIELVVPIAWVGKSIVDLNVRAEYGVNIVGVTRGEEVNINPSPLDPFQAGDRIIVLGSNEDIAELEHLSNE